MFFTNTGRVYSTERHTRFRRQAVHQEELRSSICSSFMPGEKITAVIPIEDYRDRDYLFMATKKGLVKKTPLREYYANVRKTGLAAITSA